MSVDSDAGTSPADFSSPARLGGPALSAEPPPQFASARASLRSGMPSVYQDPPEGFLMRFLEGLEQVLDPRLAIVECLGSYIARDLAPSGMVLELSEWLGLDLTDVPPDTSRSILAAASELALQRGTKAGLSLLLGLCLPAVTFELTDSPNPPASEAASGATSATLTVRTGSELSPAQERTVRRVVAAQCPLHVTATLVHGGRTVMLGEEGA
jgi:phage tail-like protein